MKIPKNLPVNPKRCPAPDHCICISRSSGDPDPDEHETIWCMGIRKSNDFPGKIQALQNVPSDVIVKCTLIGGHSEDKGAQTGITNVADQILDIECLFKGLHRLCLLIPSLRGALNCRQDLINEVHGAMLQADNPVKIKKGSRMCRVRCSCEWELFRWYEDTHKLTEREWLFIDAHIQLGHETVYLYEKFDGKKWDILERQDLNEIRK